MYSEFALHIFIFVNISFIRYWSIYIQRNVYIYIFISIYIYIFQHLYNWTNRNLCLPLPHWSEVCTTCAPDGWKRHYRWIGWIGVVARQGSKKKCKKESNKQSARSAIAEKITKKELCRKNKFLRCNKSCRKFKHAECI